MVRLFLLSLALSSCSLVPDPRPSRSVTLVSWNVENLFDEVDDGNEYPEFDPARGWTRAQFWSRCEALAQVLRPLSADVLVLEEVENSHTLEVLRTRFLPTLGYRYWFLAPDEVRGVKTAVLSRFPLLRTGLHFPVSNAPEPLRPVVEAEISLGERPLIVLGAHFKSRIPTPAATEGLRRESAKVLARRIAQLESRTDAPLVVAVGDFNTSLELSRSRPDRAFVPSGVYDGSEPGLVVFAHRADVRGPLPAGAVWDPWETSSAPGTYLYRGDWDRLDHTFVAASALGFRDWQFASFDVVAYAPEPLAYGPRTPKGVSDHFPVRLVLERASP